MEQRPPELLATSGPVHRIRQECSVLAPIARKPQEMVHAEKNAMSNSCIRSVSLALICLCCVSTLAMAAKLSGTVEYIDKTSRTIKLMTHPAQPGVPGPRQRVAELAHWRACGSGGDRRADNGYAQDIERTVTMAARPAGRSCIAIQHRRGEPHNVVAAGCVARPRQTSTLRHGVCSRRPRHNRLAHVHNRGERCAGIFIGIMGLQKSHRAAYDLPAISVLRAALKPC